MCAACCACMLPPQVWSEDAMKEANPKAPSAFDQVALCCAPTTLRSVATHAAFSLRTQGMNGKAGGFRVLRVLRVRKSTRLGYSGYSTGCRAGGRCPMTTACGALPHAAIDRAAMVAAQGMGCAQEPAAFRRRATQRCVRAAVRVHRVRVCACACVRACFYTRTHARTHNIAHTVEPDRHRAAREVDSLLILAHSARGGPTPSSCAAAS